MKPYILEPIPDYTIWGNDNLSKFRHADKNYGTWWEVSAHPYCTNKIKGEEFTLQKLIDNDMENTLGKGITLHDMLRVAFLDAKQSLSIQVHPYDAYAMEHENDFGKDESWYIIDAQPGAKLVAGTTINDPEIIRQAIADGTLEQYLSYHEVKKAITSIFHPECFMLWVPVFSRSKSEQIPTPHTVFMITTEKTKTGTHALFIWKNRSM